MDIYQRKSRWKWSLAAAATLIVAVSAFYTYYVTDKLSREEEKKMELLKSAYQTMSQAMGDTSQCDVTFQTEFFASNTTVPITIVPPDGSLIGVNHGEANDTNLVFLNTKIQELEAAGKVPDIITDPTGDYKIYFEHSRILHLLKLYPLLQFILIAAFIAFGYFAFSTSRRAEQNRVWAGMAKETAHQLGTPISGIVAWIEHLKIMREDDEEAQEVLGELRNDVVRLELIADRFSKIGSAPELSPVNIYDEIERCRQYMQRRAPRKVAFHFPDPASTPMTVQINSHLFDWVVENLIRNALDAIEGGAGSIRAEIYRDSQFVYVDVSDTGKGIPASKFKMVFQPGYTTKKRGWGLGLSLAKRIIEDYHLGKIFVKKSAPNQGTTFTIQLPL